MHSAIRDMLRRYDCRTRDDYINALRDILQSVALLGLWRSKFFDRAAFYGGSALRILYGLDRYSEDLDFSLLRPDNGFSLGNYGAALCREIGSFGFQVDFEPRSRRENTAIESAFLKANTCRELIVIEASDELLHGLHPGKQLKIKIEVDTDPPGGFQVGTEYVLQPLPFPVRVYSLPDLFAGKVHAVLCRKWKSRVKGRDWFDLAWYVSRHPELRIGHLEARMRQTGDYSGEEPLNRAELLRLMRNAVDNLDIDGARKDVEPFVRDRRLLEVWSRDFFQSLVSRIKVVD